jgi:hypothetical protein
MLPVSQSNQAFSWQPPLCAWVLFGAIAFGSTTRAFAQETPKPQTQAQTGASFAGQTAADQAPSAPAPPAPVALYNLLESKSIVFPDIRHAPGGPPDTTDCRGKGRLSLFVRASK